MERKESIGKDATSKETLEDLEENEASVEDPDAEDLPSPDGEFDDANEKDQADPMYPHEPRSLTPPRSAATCRRFSPAQSV